MKNLIVLLLIFSGFFASCCKQTDELAKPKEEVVKQPAGEKVIYVGKHEACEGALLFKRQNGKYLRATNYPAEALNLKVGAEVYIEFHDMQLAGNDAQDFATVPVEITKVTPVIPGFGSVKKPAGE